jgi:hypothetical protein
MKLFKNLILVLATFFIFELTFTKDANAAACTVTDGVYSEAEIKSGCEATPDKYEIVLYKIYLCTSEPTIPTTSATVVLTNCSQIFNNDNGATASLVQLGSVDLTGTYTKPPNGTYTHGYAMMGNTFGLTASIQIDGSMDGQASGSGVFCGTVAATGNYTKGSGAHDNESTCGSSAITAGKYVETLTHFGAQSEDWASSVTAENINGTTADITGLLVDTNGHLASTEGEVDKMEGLVTFADSITVTTDSRALTMSFNIGEGMTLASGGGDEIYIGSGPFQAIFELD